MKYRIILLALAAWIIALPVYAQTVIVTACGTNLPGNYPVGSTGQPLTMDPTGVLCSSGSGGGGGGGGAITAASGSYAAGAMSAGSYAAGALSAGAFAAGAGVDGWDSTQGATTDAAATAGGTGTFSAKFRLMTTQLATVGTNIGAPGATVCATDTGSCSINALFQRLLQGVTTLNGNVSAAIPAGTNIIGKVGIDQTTPGTTNGVQTLSGSTTVVTGNSAVIGPTADGSAASTPPVLIAGTTDGTATGLVSIPKVSAGGLVSTDGSAVTQPVSAASLPLPSGAATAAKQPALGTAGTASADVITTQSPSVDPCQTIVQTSTPISITTATTTRIIAPTSAKKTYICYLFLTSAAADNVGIVEGTGGTCGSGTAGVIGGTTAANGPNFAANGGMAMSAGGKTAVAFTAGTNVDFCLITSAATPLAGTVKWVQAP